jgi:16S rRNA pseudouridine516 synthase
MSADMRLDKLLVHMGVGSRNEVKQMAKQGLVCVDGRAVKDTSLKVDAQRSLIEVNGQRIVFRAFIYLMMHKPAGVISATEDRTLKTVTDLLPAEYAHFSPFPVGRLDRDTEGLLLLTNDGKLAHELLSPRKHVPKTYFAFVDGAVTAADGAAFASGVTLDDGYVTLPAQLRIEAVEGQQSRVLLTITEGKFHQVKRMFAARGKTVTYLKRLSMGSLHLDEQLLPGQVRELTEAELERLKGNHR